MLSMADDKTALNLKISVDLDVHLTWGELLRFVDLARPDVSPGDPVGIEFDENTMEAQALYAYLPADRLPPS